MKRIWEECDVVMLPTDKNGKILKFKNSLSCKRDWDLKSSTNQFHIHITSDDEIKKGDYACSIYGFVIQVDFIDDLYIHHVGGGNNRIDCYKKIIATTDKSLSPYTKGEWDVNEITGGQKYYHLPQLSQSFIEKFVELGGIDKVLVEYEITNRCCGRCDGRTDECVTDLVCSTHMILGCEECFGPRGDISNLIIENNTINIKLIEPKLFTISEVKVIIRKHSDFISDTIDYDAISNATTAIGIPEWDDTEFFKNNL